MSAGLYFLALGTRPRPRSERDKKQRRTRMRSLFLSPTERDFTEEEQDILRDVEQQLENHRQAPSDRTCPDCERPGVTVKIKDVEVDYCMFCKGCWFDPGELQCITGLDEDVPSSDLPSRESQFHCPVCQTRMTEHVFLRPYNLLVDRCPRGHGVYLEHGELKRAFQRTPASPF